MPFGDKPFDPLDATRQPIVLDSPYGYSTNSSGNSKVVIGIPMGFTKTGLVKLKVVKTIEFLYGYEHTPPNYSWMKTAEVVNVRPHTLFKISKGDYDACCKT